MAKHSLRQELLTRRLTISDGDAAAFSHRIAEKLLTTGLLDVPRVASYHPLTRYREIDTRAIHEHISVDRLTIVQPSKHARIPEGYFDSIIIPVVGFDDHGTRIGHGGGWYNTFLAGQPAAVKIGLAYELSHVPILPRDSHDIALDYVITEHAIYTWLS